MIPLATIREIADGVKLQILEGVKAVHAGELLTAELHFSLAQQALLKLQRLLDADAATQPPLRVLAIVGPRDKDGDPEWFARKANSEDPNAA